MTRILGISAFYHDSAAVLVVDGIVVAAAQEERFTRIKHDQQFPANAIRYCLENAGLTEADLDHVVFYEKPFLKFERLLETHLAMAPRGFLAFAKAMPVWVHEKLQLPRVLARGLNGLYTKRFIFSEHHESHAASAFFPSPFEESAILVMDGVGEWATATLGHGRANRIDLTHEMRFPHSLGLLYSAFTYFCGFRVNSGEYKLMGLAPYGQPRFERLILDNLIDLKADGSFRMNLPYFSYCAGLTMTSARFDRLFGGPPRAPEAPLTQRELDIAASIQKVTETIMLRMAGHVHGLTGSSNLCLAGGVALNCVGNGRLLRDSAFKNVWIQPAAGDSGGALGSALFVWHQLLGNPRSAQRPDSQRGSLLGPAYSNEEVREALDALGATYEKADGGRELAERVAALIAEGHVVGWMQGRMEFGPRALGSRSILGDARNPAMQSEMNVKIKFRESFRPFAPIVIRERASDYFDLEDGKESPYMLLVAAVREQRRRIPTGVASSSLERVNQVRSEIPAVTHIDYSARIQTVDSERNPRLRELLEAFERRTGCPVLVNTSFNVRGEPIVRTPHEAYRCFMATHMDVLVIEDFILLKADQSQRPEAEARTYVESFGKD